MGPIAVLVNNAANDQRQAADEVSEEDWDRTMALNLKHQFFAAQIARRSMRELGRRGDRQLFLDRLVNQDAVCPAGSIRRPRSPHNR